MKIQLDAATQKRFEQALQSAGYQQDRQDAQSEFLNHLLDRESIDHQQIESASPEFVEQLKKDLSEGREEIARGEFVTEEQLMEHLDARRTARHTTLRREQAA